MDGGILLWKKHLTFFRGKQYPRVTEFLCVNSVGNMCRLPTQVEANATLCTAEGKKTRIVKNECFVQAGIRYCKQAVIFYLLKSFLALLGKVLRSLSVFLKLIHLMRMLK